MAQIIRITSEALQATIRRLLPSQQGFGEDLQASNVIQPIIDLTPTAEGSILREDLQTAVTFTQANTFSATGASATIVNTPGFYRLIGSGTIQQSSSTTRSISIDISDGLSTKSVWKAVATSDAVKNMVQFNLDLVFFLDTGETATANAGSFASLNGSARQIADKQGNFVDPAGYSSE